MQEIREVGEIGGQQTGNVGTHDMKGVLSSKFVLDYQV